MSPYISPLSARLKLYSLEYVIRLSANDVVNTGVGSAPYVNGKDLSPLALKGRGAVHMEIGLILVLLVN